MHTDHLDRRVQLQQNRLADYDLTGFCAQVLDFVFLEIHSLSGAVASY